MFSNAYAQAAPGGGDIFASLFPLILIFAVFYFLIIRPQNKRRKEHENKVNAIAKKDQVITSGGMYGTVTKVDETTLEIEIAKGTVVKVVKNTILQVLDKDDSPVKEEKKAPAKTKTTKKKASAKKTVAKK